jgi:chorismate mutase
MKKELTNREKIQHIRNTIKIIDDKILELQKHRKDLLKHIESIKLDMEFDKMYD